MSELRAVHGRVIVAVDMQVKNWHTFSHGETIRHERGPNNLNYRETQPVQGEVLDSAIVPAGHSILFQHNACHDYYRIFNYKQVSGLDIASEVRYFSIPESACYLSRAPGAEWTPIKGIATGLRVFTPYRGMLVGIPHAVIKDVLCITGGELKGLVVHTVRAADYEIVFQGADGKEGNIIRLRHWDNPEDDIHHREEIVMIDHEKTEMVRKGELYLGLTSKDAKAVPRGTFVDIDEEAPLNSRITFNPQGIYDSEKSDFLLNDEFGQWAKL